MSLALPAPPRRRGGFHPPSAPRARAALPWPAWALLALVPPLWTAWHVAQTAVNVPFWDSWQLVFLLELDGRGDLALADLWRAHNGHRVVLPRLLMLGLARLSAWDVRWEQAASLLFALASLGLVALCIRRSFLRAAPGWIPWLVLLASALTFSLSQWENWGWGWQVQVLMVAFFGALTAWLAARSRGRRRDLALMLGAATGGALCFGAGLALYGVVVLALLLGPRPAARRERGLQLGCAALAAAAAFAALLPRQTHLQQAPPGEPAWSAPVDLALFVCAYLGAPLASRELELSVLLGAGGLGALAVLAAVLLRRAPELRAPLLPWLLLGAFAVGSALLTGLARLELGYDQALVPRYVTLANPLWIALGCAAALGLARTLRARSVAERPLRIARVAAAASALATLGGLLLVDANRLGLRMLRDHARTLEHGRALLLMRTSPPAGSLDVLFDDGQVRDLALTLHGLGLSLFAREPPSERLEAYERVSPRRVAGSIDSVRPDPDFPACLVLEGWAVDPFGPGVAEAVLVAVGGEVVGRAEPSLPREDVRVGLRRPAGFRPGWSLHLMAVPPRWHGSPLEAFALLPGGRIAPLRGARELPVDPGGG